jgi:hypothetical protein
MPHYSLLCTIGKIVAQQKCSWELFQNIKEDVQGIITKDQLKYHFSTWCCSLLLHAT